MDVAQQRRSGLEATRRSENWQERAPKRGAGLSGLCVRVCVPGGCGSSGSGNKPACWPDHLLGTLAFSFRLHRTMNSCTLYCVYLSELQRAETTGPRLEEVRWRGGQEKKKKKVKLLRSTLKVDKMHKKTETRFVYLGE